MAHPDTKMCKVGRGLCSRKEKGDIPVRIHCRNKRLGRSTEAAIVGLW